MPQDLHYTDQEHSELTPARPFHPNESASSGVSWGAVIAGAFVASSFYLILLALGAGLGLSSVSPWSYSGLSASAVGGAAIVWLIFSEAVASGLGGYLTGRLRTKWAAIHNDEVYFRDTANGFLAWAVALVVTSAFLASAAAGMAGRAAQQPVRSANSSAPETSYYVDLLFRGDRAADDSTERAEAGRVLTRALAENEMPASDREFLLRTIVARTGINPGDADRRLTDTLNIARQDEDNARRLIAHLLLWMFLALLIGAFTASYAATLGGRQRDHVVAV